MDPKTIRRGMRENRASGVSFPRRVRRPGGGRMRREDETPSLVEALDDLLCDVTAGDPGSRMKWTKRSTRKLARALRRQGFRIGYRTVARLLHRRQYSLRTNRKCLPGTQHRDRDRQFRYVVRQRHRYLHQGWPVVSVDAKKREMVGNFKNPGQCWRREPRKVLDHDFRRNALGVAIIYGIYDVARNVGYVVVGCSHETAGFAVAAIRRWWLRSGCHDYVGARRLLIEADGGGANSSRTLAWKVALQRLADELQIVICVSHLPPGASKWNLIEHRMFSLISENWAGEPLQSYGIILELLRHTTSESGFQCQAMFDRTKYSTAIKTSRQTKATLKLRPRRILPQWNYVILPHKPRHKPSN